MRRLSGTVVLLSAVLWLTGCSDRPGPVPNPAAGTSLNQPSPPPPPPPPPSPPSSDPLSPHGVAGGPSTGQTTAQPQSSSTMPAAVKPQTTTERQQAIRLSAGVALPQTGPEGTLMSFSVDYEFTQGEPSSSGYVWVIQRARGGPARQPVQLSRQGNLPILINGWRQEDGPFQTHIEDRSGNRLSEVIELPSHL
jgi:hypothetical protein